MAHRIAVTLCWCIAAIGLVRCAELSQKESKALEQYNKDLQRQIADQKDEVRRLQRYAALQREDEAPKPVISEVEPQVPLMVLKKKDEKNEEDDFSEDRNRQRKTLATSHFENMTWYQQGTELLRSGKYDQASRAFTTFLQQEPDHVYADRAQFWIAESHFRAQDYALAIVADNAFAARYPDSIKLPDVLYRTALSHLAMGHKGAAREILRELLREFPNGQTAGPASKKLAELEPTRS